MTSRLDRLAWFGVALAVLTWAIAPRLALAHTIVFPKEPAIAVSVLAPPVYTDPPETKGLTETAQPGR